MPLYGPRLSKIEQCDNWDGATPAFIKLAHYLNARPRRRRGVPVGRNEIRWRRWTARPAARAIWVQRQTLPVSVKSCVANAV